MEKIKKIIKSNYHYIILALLFLSAGYTVWHFNYYCSDDFYYKRIAASDWNVIFNFIKWHIKNLNGRTIVHFSEMMFMRYKYGYIVWEVLESFAITGICAASAKMVSKTEADFKRACVASVFFFSSAVPFFWRWSFSWMPGSFNYILPCAGVVLLMLLSQKRCNSFWFYPLSLICSATTEQAGIMTIGVFVILIGENLLRNKKLNKKYFICFLISILGYSTVIFSPGIINRSDVQGKLGLSDMMVNMLTVLRRRWLDNLYIAVLMVSIAVFAIFWLVKYKNQNRVTKKINIPVSIALGVLMILNYGLKAVLLAARFLKINIENVQKFDNIFFTIYIIYLVLYFGAFCYSTILIYQNKKDLIPFMAFVLGFGSQIMLALSETSHFRMCVPGYFMFMIYAVYSSAALVNDMYNCEKISKKIGPVIRSLPIIICAVACIAQGVIGAKVVLKGTRPADYVDDPISINELDEFYSSLKKDFTTYYSGDMWHEKYDIKDFTLIR